MMLFLKRCFILSLFVLPNSIFSDTLTVSGNPTALTINTATAGQQPNSVTNSTTSYSVTTTLTTRKITGKLNSTMPSNVTLSVGFAPSVGATSVGPVSMSTTAKNLVTGVPILTTSSANVITYTLSATASASKVTGATRTLTLTLQ